MSALFFGFTARVSPKCLDLDLETENVIELLRTLSYDYIVKLEKGANIKENVHFQGFIRTRHGKPFIINSMANCMNVPKNYIHLSQYTTPASVCNGMLYVLKSDTQYGPIFCSENSSPLYTQEQSEQAHRDKEFASLILDFDGDEEPTVDYFMNDD